MDADFRTVLRSYILNGCTSEQLTGHGVIFGYIKEERTRELDGTDSPLFHFFLEDDEWWSYRFSIDGYWFNDMIDTLHKAKAS